MVPRRCHRRAGAIAGMVGFAWQRGFDLYSPPAQDMKIKLILVTFLLTTWFAHGQGVLIVDQQSTNQIEGSAGLYSPEQPMGQSFTPIFSLVGFVRLNLYDS